MAYAFRVRNNKRLPAGFLWIGFPIGGNKLLRFGLFSTDKNDPGLHGRIKWSFSLFDITSPRRTIRAMLPIPIQYLEMEWDDMHPVVAHGDAIAANSNDTTLDQEKADDAFKLLL